MKSIDWKAFLKGPFFIILVAAVAFFAGRQLAPEKLRVVTIDKVTEIHHEQTQITQKIDIDSLMKQIQDKTKSVNRNVVREVIVQKDGTKIERETDLSKIDSTQHTDTVQQERVSTVSDIKQILDSYRAEEHSRIVTTETNPDKWRVGLAIGYSKGASLYLPQIPNDILVGAYVERKLFSSVSGGVWVNNNPGVGLQLSVGL